ncbi:MAG: hypothetical protein ABEH43_08665, partial [Flavobacteriales bacterium]
GIHGIFPGNISFCRKFYFKMGKIKLDLHDIYNDSKKVESSILDAIDKAIETRTHLSHRVLFFLCFY